MVFTAYTTSSNSGASSLTFTSPSVSGTHTYGVVGVLVQTSLTITGVTWNGTAMTFVGGQTNNGGTDRIELWAIQSPSAGATSIVISRTGSSNGIFGHAACYSSVKQTTRDAVATLDQLSGTTLTSSLTSVATYTWGVLFAKSETSTLSASTNTTFRSAGGALVLGDSNGVFTPAGSKSMVVTSAVDSENYSVMATFEVYSDSSTISDTQATSDTIAQTISMTINDTTQTTDTISATLPDWKTLPKSSDSSWTAQIKS